MRAERLRIGTLLLAVPLLLAGADFLSQVIGLRFLLFPPLAAILYQAFSDPHGPRSRLRCLVLSPVLGATVGAAAARLWGDTPWSVAFSSLGVLGLMLLLRSEMPPAVAVNVLAIFVGAGTPLYPLGVLLATTGATLVFWGWRRLGYERVADRFTD